MTQLPPGPENPELQAKEEPETKPVCASDVFEESRKMEESETSVSLWLITFTDVMALMLTFFVLLYSMSVPEVEKWDEVSTAITEGFKQYKSASFYEGAEDTIDIEKVDLSRALDLNYLQALIKEIMGDDELYSEVVLIPQEGRLIISLPTTLLFETGTAQVNTQGKRVLFALGEPLSRIRNRIEIIGHADPRPIQGKSEFKSNWDLSLSRAVNVAAVLGDVGYDRGIITRGLSSARYDELPEDFSEDERLSLARRVDIIIMEDDGSKRFLFR